MKNNVIICTHHKTGTVWMHSLFLSIAEALNKKFVNYHVDGFDQQASQKNTFFIMLNYHSRFNAGDEALAAPPTRLLHLYRDPRDVIISATHYHKISAEPWLHIPQDRFSGKTYQEEINSIDDMEAAFQFEMENFTNNVIREMETWNYGLQNCVDVQYEDLIADRRLRAFTRIFRSLGFEKEEIVACRAAAKNLSLFGKMTKQRNPHIRSGRARQWEQVFTPKLAREFHRRFPTVLQTLGYERDDRWVDRCGNGHKSGIQRLLQPALGLRKRLPF